MHVPEAGALLVEAVVAAQPVALGCRDVGRLDLVGGHHGQRGHGVVRRRRAHDGQQARPSMGVAGASGVAPAAAREGLEELHVRFGRAELVGQVRLHELAGASRRQRVGDGRQRHRELALNVAVLLRVGGQLALGEGAGLPATVEGVVSK